MAAAACMVALACATAAAGATPKSYYKSFFINCGPAPATGPAKQLCPRPPKTAVLATIDPGAAPVVVTYIAGPTHCSQVVLRVYVDGKKVGETARLNAQGTGSLSFDVTPHEAHKLGFVEQGFVGGCNSGVLVSIAGKIHVAYTP